MVPNTFDHGLRDTQTETSHHGNINHSKILRNSRSFTKRHDLLQTRLKTKRWIKTVLNKESKIHGLSWYRAVSPHSKNNSYICDGIQTA